jgi:8-amino-3,8-dideoxy-alpha-D-manno-octulosonate transaminase
MTNSEDAYIKCDGFTDHGHDHKEQDRGADQHPFLGYNFRISELHAAVGLAQIRRLDDFLQIQKRNHSALKNALSDIAGISFRRIPDPVGDSCSFVSWFLPSAEDADRALEALKSEGIQAGNFYWYNNNWHYIRKWDHLKQATSLYRLSPVQEAALKRLSVQDFSESDQILSRCISTLINLTLSEEQAKEKGRKIAEAVNNVLKPAKFKA